MRVTLPLVAAFLLLPPRASATLVGEAGELSYFFPDLTTQFTGSGYAPQAITVGPGTEVAFFGNAKNPNMSLDVTADEAAEFRSLADAFSEDALLRVFNALLDLPGQLRLAPQPRFALEAAAHAKKLKSQ